VKKTTEKTMTIYPEEQKARLIERMLPPEAIPVPQLSQETGIPKDTLYGWRGQACRARGLPMMGPSPTKERWSGGEKFTMVVETAALNEAQRGEYCRKRGVYPEQLQRWRQRCAQANGEAKPSRVSAETRSQAQRIQALERELRRKDKALAETAALLVLRKKAEAIWGQDEDD
jgi:transposase-like protein